MPAWLRVDVPFVTFLGYPMSFLELSGTALNVWAVQLMIRRSLLTWPVGLVAVVLFGVLFYQIRLYADLFEQVYYFAANCWGWWLWSRGSADGGGELPVTANGARLNAGLAVGSVLASAGAGWGLSRLHLWLPSAFPQPAAFPYIDALTSVMGLVAQTLAAYKRIENWHLWIVVNVLSAGIYYAQGVRFVALLYVGFLFLAVRGLWSWRAELARRPGAVQAV